MKCRQDETANTRDMTAILLRNPASRRNRRAGLADLQENTPQGLRAVTLRDPAALPGLAARLCADGVTHVAIDGGDGTVRAVITALMAAYAGHPPAIGILARGNTNLIARRLGRLRAEDLQHLPELPVAPAPVLRVEGFASGPEYGFILGWGAYADATARAQGAGSGAAQVLRSLARVIGEARRVGIRAPLAVDGHAGAPGRSFGAVVTALPGRLIAGINPFWGAPMDAPMRWTHVAAPAPYLPVCLPALAFGIGGRWLPGAYRSGAAEELGLTLDGTLIIDGDPFAPPDGRLRITADTVVPILRPRLDTRAGRD
ncbi:MAG: diacylglycerol kinase family protein [Pseudomonadota bacterium]